MKIGIAIYLKTLYKILLSLKSQFRILFTYFLVVLIIISEAKIAIEEGMKTKEIKLCITEKNQNLLGVKLDIDTKGIY